MAHQVMIGRRPLMLLLMPTTTAGRAAQKPPMTTAAPPRTASAEHVSEPTPRRRPSGNSDGNVEFLLDHNVVVLNNGRRMPLVGLGTYMGAPGVVGHAVEVAIKQGYRHIDAAHLYGNEKEVGEGIAAALKAGLARREDLFVVSKLWNTDHRRVREAYTESCRKLGLDYLDMYLIHWPMTMTRTEALDPPYRDTWRQMEQLYQEGLVKCIGVSNVSIKKLQELLEYAEVVPQVNQVEVHPFFRNDDLIAFCDKHGIHVSAYAPLGSPGNLQDKSMSSPAVHKDPMVVQVAKELGKTPQQVLVRWGLQHGTSVLPKSVTESHIKENIEVFDFSIPEAAYKALSSFDLQLREVDFADKLYPASPWRTLMDLWDDPEEEARILRFARTQYAVDIPQPRVKLSSGASIPRLGVSIQQVEGEEATKRNVVHAVRCGYRRLDCIPEGRQADSDILTAFRRLQTQSPSPEEGGSALQAAVQGVRKQQLTRGVDKIGLGLEEVFWEGVVLREDVWVSATLVVSPDEQQDFDVGLAAQTTLKNLQVEYVDLLLLRFPEVNGSGAAAAAPALSASSLDTWRSAGGLVERGLVRHLGVSGLSRAQLDGLLQHVGADAKPAVLQVDVERAWRDEGLLSLCEEQGIHVTVFVPSGPAPAVGKKGVLEEVARKTGLDKSDVLRNWALHRGCSVLVDGGDLEGVKQGVGKAECELPQEELLQLCMLEGEEEEDELYRYQAAVI